MPQIPTRGASASFLPTTGPNESAARASFVAQTGERLAQIEQSLHEDRVRKELATAELEATTAFNKLSLAAKTATDSTTVVDDFTRGFEKEVGRIRTGLTDKRALEAFDLAMAENFASRMVNVQAQRIRLHREESFAIHAGVVDEAQKAVQIDNSNTSIQLQFRNIENSHAQRIATQAETVGEANIAIQQEKSTVLYHMAVDMLNHNRFADLKLRMTNGDFDAMTTEARLKIEQNIEAKEASFNYSTELNRIEVDGLASVENQQHLRDRADLGDITESAYRDLTMRNQAQMRKREKAGALKEGWRQHNLGMLLDPSNPDHVAIANYGFQKYANEVLEALPPDSQLAGMLEFSQTHGIIPDAVRGMFMAQANQPESNPEFAAQAAFGYARLMDSKSGSLFKPLPKPFDRRFRRIAKFREMKNSREAVSDALAFEKDAQTAAAVKGFGETVGAAFDKREPEDIKDSLVTRMWDKGFHPMVPGVTWREYLDSGVTQRTDIPGIDAPQFEALVGAVGRGALRLGQFITTGSRPEFAFTGPQKPSDSVTLSPEALSDYRTLLRAEAIQNGGILDEAAHEAVIGDWSTKWGPTRMFGPPRIEKYSVESRTLPIDGSWDWVHEQGEAEFRELLFEAIPEIKTAFPVTLKGLANELGGYFDRVAETPTDLINPAAAASDLFAFFTGTENRETFAETAAIQIMSVIDPDSTRGELRTTLFNYTSHPLGSIVSGRTTALATPVIAMMSTEITPTGRTRSGKHAPQYIPMMVADDGTFKPIQEVFIHLSTQKLRNATWVPDRDEYLATHLRPDQLVAAMAAGAARSLALDQTIQGASENAIEQLLIPGTDPGALTPEDQRRRIEEWRRQLPGAT